MATHRIRLYGGDWERVTVISDDTHSTNGFRIGTMKVIGADGKERTVRSTPYNGIEVEPLN